MVKGTPAKWWLGIPLKHTTWMYTHEVVVMVMRVPPENVSYGGDVAAWVDCLLNSVGEKAFGRCHYIVAMVSFPSVKVMVFWEIRLARIGLLFHSATFFRESYLVLKSYSLLK